ncbi:hypothetical protein GCM10017044_14700 [Kordiimonas sediminis]|uniref:Glyoxalase-related protein domain-containing protein n=1 Tax=Kordiimonas sediminis TaxID=1735581 RepID=A0A919AQM0_9PROT|nr:glyoxalase superfamily protein [Kordiimonas sediminis]GHF20846.1 hypothetical protein GCM10017044_14700 [Kordiimonas sediminis]
MITITQIKAGAKRLRSFFSDKDIKLSHSDGLEAMAFAHGFRDWNTCSATLRDSEGSFRPLLGDRVIGAFRDQSAVGQITALSMISPKPKYAPDALKVKIKFDSPVDVITSERMQGLRSYMWLFLDNQGHTIDRLGRPDGNGCFRIDGR